MTSLYRVNYQLRTHKRDPLIEFIKAMLMTPFVLHAKPPSSDLQQDRDWSAAANRTRYAEIMANVEELVTVFHFLFTAGSHCENSRGHAEILAIVQPSSIHWRFLHSIST